MDAENAFAYHLDARSKLPVVAALAEERCALCDGTLAKSNGIVLGPEHSDLRCSAHPCSYDVCPCALAACFCAYRANDPIADIPLYDKRKEQGRHIQRAADASRAKWRDKLRDSDLALSLLCSPTASTR